MTSHIVITTIQEPTLSVYKLIKAVGKNMAMCIVIGDKKGPASFNIEGADLYTLEHQLSLPFTIASRLPTGHYSRKNIGYLIAISEGASSIYETDDDNEPLGSWGYRDKIINALTVSETGWVNVYSAFTDELIWPRGFPLDEILRSIGTKLALSEKTVSIEAPIQQGLAAGSPDVDAVWRLVLDKEIQFTGEDSIVLKPGSWCPFNSQSTWWWPEAYPLLYLPSFCSFRMTDIWRSFIAQRCLWAMGYGIAYHPQEVYQRRNEHDLMRDFTDEVPGYLENRSICKLLEGLDVSGNKYAVSQNLFHCYEALVTAGYLPDEEMELVEAWIHDLEEM